MKRLSIVLAALIFATGCASSAPAGSASSEKEKQAAPGSALPSTIDRVKDVGAAANDRAEESSDAVESLE
ncbi:MAG: hypothetical protein ACYC1U_02155 [Candidatus Aquicultorales bacterium]